MRTYSDYMYEITKDDLYLGLLSQGLFSERLPDCFSSKDFYEYCVINDITYKTNWNQFVYYENIRDINIPRQIGIPTPMSYQKLCKCLRDSWDIIQEFFSTKTSNQVHKVSRIHIRKMKNSNLLFEMSYPTWKTDGTLDPELSIGMKYMVEADISQCFPSIYTHAIPWALVGKEKAKECQKGEWFNNIDKFVRNTKNGETHGILIGPHAYNIISEIILCAIDERLVEKGWKYIRNIDDYACYVEDETKAKEFLVDLQFELRKYDLALNHRKTRIRKLPLALNEQWVRKINSIDLITSYNQVDYKHCRTYLDCAIEIAKNENDNSAAVLKYAIKVLSGKTLTNNAKKYEQQEVFMLVLIYPYLIPLLDKYVFEACDTTVEDIKRISVDIYNEYMPRLRFEAVSYSLYFAIIYGFNIENIDVERIIEHEDCVLLTMTFIYCEKIGDTDSLNILKQYAKSLVDSGEFEKFWLFAYEALEYEDLNGEWAELKKSGVSFIDFD